MYEVEMKFCVCDVAMFECRLGEMGVKFAADAVEEVDRFYLHPQRNFKQTDECLRIRVRKFIDGREEKFLTYKGAKLDNKTKTRRELEIQINDNITLELILMSLGFKAADSVRKFRRQTEIIIDNITVELLLDFVPELADETNNATGNFVEIETIASESDLDLKRNLIIELAQKLNLTEPIRTSYLELIRPKQQKNIFYN
ncbi:MAG: class IV adenylate cyclase [Planctomycetaceae bacterium]|jgi:adenylate cyclase class 2|nr:class IV adenylate cyclase [Planctomycetaceae bacterium]